jgi:hypothetical protein
VLLVCSVFLRLPVNAQPSFTLPDNPTFKPEVEVRQEDYAKARREFRTRLVRRLPSPQAADDGNGNVNSVLVINP